MSSTPATLFELNMPATADTGTDFVTFLESLPGPAWITIPGRDNSRSRAIITLLHGNEPSGLKAVHEFLQSGRTPATRLGICIASVSAALEPPLLSHRYLPNEEDLNRCFSPPFNTDQRKLAAAILQKLVDFNPEAVIDTHNTSAHSEPFAVTTDENISTRQLTELFTSKMVVMDLKLGTLVEQAQLAAPVITIEFGGFMDPRADAVAVQSVNEFIARDSLFGREIHDPHTVDTDRKSLTVLRHPHRLEVSDDGHALHYASSVQNEADITIMNTIDQMNFRQLPIGTRLGWLGERGLSALRLVSAAGEDLLSHYLTDDRGFIVTTRPLTVFMPTTDPYIAKRDCLLYLTPA
jgi:hypothetical protein